MKFQLFECVTLKIDLPERRLKAGTAGVIIDIYTVPSSAYEVEFCDEDGKTIELLALTEVQIEKA
jgi:Domain of unknown function (DUF4926)